LGGSSERQSIHSLQFTAQA
jgi:hypothetical protein